MPRATPFPHRILVVDDDLAVAEALVLLLGALGYPVWHAEGGLAALEAVERWQPTVVLLDLDMPGLNGFEVAQALRARQGQPLCLIAHTGRQEAALRKRVLAAGFDHYLPKPMTAAALRALLET
jgi:CheY-like chemotaxis protein